MLSLGNRRGGCAIGGSRPPMVHDPLARWEIGRKFPICAFAFQRVTVENQGLGDVAERLKAAVW
jgi:hypothetical protein